MKILVVGDVHWNQYSSILRSNGEKYSLRLENLIQSINWAEKLSKENQCDICVYLGDFFDRADLNSIEITALNELKWDNNPHYFLVGNHETSRADLLFNSANIFGLQPDFYSFNSPTEMYTNDSTIKQLCFLPYILEKDRKNIGLYFSDFDISNRIIFSHNDIKGFRYGPVVSSIGFDVNDIEYNCALYLNGHLHNGSKLTNKIINVGNLTGQNFSEDAFKYDHTAIILDTKTMKCAVYENPYAINFVKLDWTEKISIPDKKNLVATIKVNNDSNIDFSSYDFLEKRIIIEKESNNNIEESTIQLSVDHLEEFKKYILKEIGTNDIILEELLTICN